MIKALTLGSVLLAAGLPASGQEVSQRAAALLDVIVAHGCTMTKAEAATALPDLGFTRGEYRGLMKELVDAGRVTLADGAATVAEGLCPSAQPQALLPFQEQYIAILRHNGCQLQTGEAESLFPRFGMEANMAAELEEGLVDSGIAGVSGGALKIGPAYCIADDSFPSLPLLELNALERHLVEVLEIGSCTLVQSEIEATFPQDSMQPDEARAAVASLLASGAALAVEGGDRVWLSPEICQPWSERKN